MKNSKFLIKMTTSVISTLFFLSCNLNEIEPTPSISKPAIVENTKLKSTYNKNFLDLLFVTGDTTLPYNEPKLHTPPDKAPDLSALKNNTDPDLKGKPIRFVSIGGSLTSGVRNGGLYRESQITSYPNMIARQMVLSQFRQPLFDDKEFNGYGYRVQTNENYSGGVLPKYKAVSNNLALNNETPKEVILSPFEGEIENWGIPFLTVGGIKYDLSIEYQNFESGKLFHPFYKRFQILDKLKSKSIYRLLQNSKADFYTYEAGIQECINFALSGGNSDYSPPISNGYDILDNDLITSSYLDLIRYVTKTNGSKICISNVPNILTFPYFKQISLDKMQSSLYSKYIYSAKKGFMVGDVLTDNILFLPTSTIDSVTSPKIERKLKKGIANNQPLSYNNVLTFSQQKEVINIQESFDLLIKDVAKKYAFPVVDLKTLYSKIMDGNYVTNDGVRVNPSFPNGNFFSMDGINPTAFGQAIIANEFIKTINSYYRTDIQFIKTAEYLQK